MKKDFKLLPLILVCSLAVLLMVFSASPMTAAPPPSPTSLSGLSLIPLNTGTIYIFPQNGATMISVKLIDRNGVGVPGKTITWQKQRPEWILSPLTSVTDQAGVAYTYGYVTFDLGVDFDDIVTASYSSVFCNINVHVNSPTWPGNSTPSRTVTPTRSPTPTISYTP